MALKKPITVHEIAKLAGVSVATVSRTLSNSNYPVSDKLKERVLKVASENDYIPNMLGKQLKTNKSMMIGAIIPTITNPFYPSVVLGIEELARQSDYYVLLSNSMQDPNLEKIYLESIFERQIKGLIIASISDNTELLSSLIRRGLKVVVIDQKVELKGATQVTFDFRKGGYLAAHHLIEKGHRKIAYISAPFSRYSRRNIYQGYRDALTEYGIKLNEDYLQVSEEEKSLKDSSYEFENGKKLTANLIKLDDPPTAIIAYNDMTALGSINELSSCGMSVPKDMSVIGFDDIDFAQMSQPGLTTIKQPKYEMGKLACELLLEMLHEDTDSANKKDLEIVLEPELVERGTVFELKN